MLWNISKLFLEWKKTTFSMFLWTNCFFINPTYNFLTLRQHGLKFAGNFYVQGKRFRLKNFPYRRFALFHAHTSTHNRIFYHKGFDSLFLQFTFSVNLGKWSKAKLSLNVLFWPFCAADVLYIFLHIILHLKRMKNALKCVRPTAF